jgi:hypothetical protein
VGEGFARDRTGRIAIELAPEESVVLQGLLRQLLTLLDDLPGGDPGLAELGISENTAPPGDAVLARLFPDGYQEDAAAATEFRRYTEASLHDTKRANAETVLKVLTDEGGELHLERDEAQVWLKVLNDLRLALGTRLEITEESYARFEELDWDDPKLGMFAAYDWLTMLQDTLVRALW